MKGTIYNYFHTEKWGFIKREDDDVNHIQFERDELEEGLLPLTGIRVEFDIDEGENGVEAINVREVETS